MEQSEFLKYLKKIPEEEAVAILEDMKREANRMVKQMRKDENQIIVLKGERNHYRYIANQQARDIAG